MTAIFLHPDYTPTETSAKLTFGGNRLNRQSEERADDCVDVALANPSTRLMGFARGRVLVALGAERASGLHSLESLSAFAPKIDRAVLLGFDGDAARLAVPLGINPDEDGFSLPDPFKAIDYRSLARQQLLDAEELGIVAQGGAVLAWHANARFSGRSGQETVMVGGGVKRRCEADGRDEFPRTDPVVIMLITHGDRCLLGRSHHFPAGMYSALAGFVEPGESIEMAVRRETHEESGLFVGDVRYHASQPWPFPHSLMIGCYGEALTDIISRDESELDDCRWFDRETIRTLLQQNDSGGPHEDGALFLPPRLAIANRLVLDWAGLG